MKFLKCNKGIATIELAMLFLPFFLFIAAIAESLVLVYRISIIDYLTDNNAKKNVTLDNNYTEQFNNNIISDSSKFFIDLNNFNTEIKIDFCKNLDELANDNCSGDDTDFKIAKYNVTYKISPIFLALRLAPSLESIKSSAVYYRENR